VLVKALPHRSSNYFETVCCAGLGRDFRWRRQYPVPFRVLGGSQQFKRWDWIKYDFTDPKNDARVESQKAVPETIVVTGSMKTTERAGFLSRMIRASPAEAESLGESLTLVRPKNINLSWIRKTDSELASEQLKHAALANQTSMFDATAKPLTPCPFAFSFAWEDSVGKMHNHTCDDWETSTAFFRRRDKLGETEGLKSIKATYENDYVSKGIAFALGTHARRPQWLLVGVLRLDEAVQGELLV
jgi:hypothetical protein